VQEQQRFSLPAPLRGHLVSGKNQATNVHHCTAASQFPSPGNLARMLPAHSSSAPRPPRSGGGGWGEAREASRSGAKCLSSWPPSAWGD